MSSNAPVGVFDSGIGGLSIAREIRQLAPGENLVYVADSKFAPYGEKSADQVLQRCLNVTDFLLEQGAKAIVVACNTATAACIGDLRDRYDIPFIGIEPGVKPAVVDSRSGTVGVLATSGTLTSKSFENLSGRFAGGITLEVMPAPELVLLVESLKLGYEDALPIVDQYLAPMLDKGVDTILLGCTHFAHLAEVIQQVAGSDIKIMRIEIPVAEELLRQLDTRNLATDVSESGSESFWSSGPIDLFERQIHTLWAEGTAVSQWIQDV